MYTKGMLIEEVVYASLTSSLHMYLNNRPRINNAPEEVVSSVQTILDDSSAPNRQLLLTFAAGTYCDPESSPQSLQSKSGTDRRSQAKRATKGLAKFVNESGYTLKISQDPGVSNQWREPKINEAWVENRRPHNRKPAEAFFQITKWLNDMSPEDRVGSSKDLLDLITLGIVKTAAGNSLKYPKFRASPAMSMTLVREFLDNTPGRPDAMEAVVTVAARQLCSTLRGKPEVTRRDINSPDPIDIVIKSKEHAHKSGIEVTDNRITQAKLQHEVYDAMLKEGLDSAMVVSAGIKEGEEEEIAEYVNHMHTHLEMRIDLVTIDVIEAWLSFPGTPPELSTNFLWGIGEELDRFSKDETRRAWFNTLTGHVAAVEGSRTAPE